MSDSSGSEAQATTGTDQFEPIVCHPTDPWGRHALAKSVEWTESWTRRFQRSCGISAPGDTASWPVHYMFCIAAALGNETFYILFLPLLMWISPCVGRQSLAVWAVQMYVGQALKELYKLPRPTTSFHMESRYVEYGMPSTHTSTAVTLAPLLLMAEMDTLAYHGAPDWMYYVAYSLTAFWVLMCPLSRLYLGVHSVADLVVGAALGGVILTAALTCGPLVDAWLLNTTGAATVLVLCVGSMSFGFPRSTKQWSTTAADTAIAVGVYMGAMLASMYDAGMHNSACDSRAWQASRWTNMQPASIAAGMAGAYVIGTLIMLATRVLMKAIAVPLTQRVVQAGAVNWIIEPASPAGEPSVSGRYAAEIAEKLIVYGSLGACATAVVPRVVDALGMVPFPGLS